MIQVDGIPTLRERRRQWRRAGLTVGFVPTMGNLHDGHLSLMEKARSLCDRTICSIYVNPLQFDRPDDLGDYPRTLAADLTKLREIGADLVFVPSTEDIYPRGMAHATTIDVPGITDVLEGSHRPDHFIGVATVVCKLFNMVQPEVAVFGEKDYQQLMVVHRMTADLNLPVRVVGAPTAREANGLAMSSRNSRLSADQRQRASAIYRAMSEAAQQLRTGEAAAAVEARALAALRDQGFEPDYFTLRRCEDLEPPRASDALDDCVILVAATLGPARLIDNLPLARNGDHSP